MTPELLSDEAAIAAWGTLEESVPHKAANGRTYTHYRPLADAAHRIIGEAQDRDRLFTGTPEFDEQMRGIGHGHLFVVTGYSHSGKTQWVMKMLRHNKKKRIVVFDPDEPDTLVLAKLASIESGVGARELEQRISDGDDDAIRILRDTAEIEFPNLIVYDKPLTPEMMRVGLEEARDVWGGKEDLIVVDYADLGPGETVQAKFDFFKGVVSREKTRMLLIHQTSRSAGAEGRKMTISSGNYGGEQHATFMVGVRRKKSALMAQLNELEEKQRKGGDVADDIAEVKRDLRIHEYTITVNLVKNKRPGGGLVDDIDLELDTETGRLYDLEPGDMPSQFLRDMDRLRTQRREASFHTTPSWEQTTFDPDTKDF
jgi:KaiC/GvpD/RAD55 family RecA-like ATPase